LNWLEFKIDPYQSADITKIVSISFTSEGIDKSWAIHIRNGVAEVKEYRPGDKVDANLQLPRSVWSKLVTSEITLNQALEDKGVTVRGSKAILSKILVCFDHISRSL
jgi:alkyl sulfatase BDS1-like metallo-beta-lactamase superfamily hydrolase